MDKNKMDLIQIIRTFSEANGPSGFEHETARVAEALAEEYGETSIDTMQNVYVRRNGNTGSRLRVHLDAHLDEVGFIVQYVHENGLLHVLPLGSWVASSVPSHLFRVRTRDGQWIPAISANKPPHFMTEAEAKAGLTMDQIELDIGASSREAAEKEFGVCVASPAIPDVAFRYLEAHDLLLGKAFDCRLGCAALTGTLKELDGEVLNCDVVAGYSVQEEVGGRGAVVTARQIGADLAIVFEGTPADDSFASGPAMQTALEKGPMLRYSDRTMITHPGFQRCALAFAEKEGIPVQTGVRSGGGTNGALIEEEGAGIPTIVIGVPVRYIHTHYGWARLCDVEASVKLAAGLLRSFDADTLSKLVY